MILLLQKKRRKESKRGDDNPTNGLSFDDDDDDEKYRDMARRFEAKYVRKNKLFKLKAKYIPEEK